MANNITINVRATVDKAISEVDRMMSTVDNLSTPQAGMERTMATAEAEVQKMRTRLDAMGPLPAPRTEQLP
jgi:outer membrane murein-binding lipoprotein Lpp